MARNDLSLRRITRNVTLPEDVLLQRRLDFLSALDRLRQSSPTLVLVNMDQTAVQFEMPPRRTVHFTGARAVPILLTDSSSLRLTVALTVTSSGQKLAPYAVFKGCLNGRIAREFLCTQNGYPQSIVYSVQRNAWMDSALVIDWISRYLFILIILESSVHMCELLALKTYA